jgi:zinc transport system substrate-binding protein
MSVLTACGCRGNSPDSPGAKLRVAVSIIPQVWLVQQIGGEYVDVVAMVSPGESHETYQPSDAQVSQVMSGAAFFRIGIPFENGRALAALRSQGKLRVVDTREGLMLRELGPLERCNETSHAGHGHGDEDEGPSQAHAHEGKDPHVWLSPRLLKAQARIIAKTLGELDPAHQAAYDRNLAATEEKLDAANGEIRRVLEPYRGKMFFVFHPAWGYFADDYGLKQVAIEAEGKEPSDEEATGLQKMARQQGIKVVFVQPQIASRGAEAIAQAIGARLDTLDPLAPDVLDNLVRAARAIADSYR